MQNKVIVKRYVSVPCPGSKKCRGIKEWFIQLIIGKRYMIIESIRKTDIKQAQAFTRNRERVISSVWFDRFGNSISIVSKGEYVDFVAQISKIWKHIVRVR